MGFLLYLTVPVFWKGSKVDPTSLDWPMWVPHSAVPRSARRSVMARSATNHFFYVEDPAARPDTRLILVGMVKLEDPASFLKIGISGDFVSLI